MLGATFIGTSMLGASLYTSGVRLFAAIIDWTPLLFTAGIAYRLKFGDRSGLPILVWFGAAYVLCSVTRVLVMLVFAWR